MSDLIFRVGGGIKNNRTEYVHLRNLLSFRKHSWLLFTPAVIINQEVAQTVQRLGDSLYKTCGLSVERNQEILTIKLNVKRQFEEKNYSHRPSLLKKLMEQTHEQARNAKKFQQRKNQNAMVTKNKHGISKKCAVTKI